MRKSLFYVLFFFACLSCQMAEAKVKQKPVYLFGFATSFTDSLAYITDVQYIDSAYIDTKTRFLIGRNMYSVQLQQYLEDKEGCSHPVTSIFFSKKKAKVDKKILSIRRRYEKNYNLKTVPCLFRPESYMGSEIIDDSGSDGVGSKPSKKNKK